MKEQNQSGSQSGIPQSGQTFTHDQLVSALAEKFNLNDSQRQNIQFDVQGTQVKGFSIGQQGKSAIG